MMEWFSRRLYPPSPEPATRDLALEGLRGLCALLVLYGHMASPIPCLDPTYSPSQRFWWLDMGSVAVLFFFVLSGYVIGLTVKSPFSGPAVRGYLGRRMLRLVPVNTAAVLISWALAPRIGLGTVLGNLGFVDNFKPYLFGWSVLPMANNPSLWTLHYELVYYLMFLAVWRFAPCAGLLFVAMGVFAAAVLLPGFPSLLSGYASGSLYWFAGLSVAWLGSKGTGAGDWPSALLAAAVMWPLAPIRELGSVKDLAEPLMAPLALTRLDLLPVCLWLLLAVTGRGQKWHRLLGVACLSEISAAWTLHFLRNDFEDRGALWVYAIAIGLAWILRTREPKPWILAKMAPIGLLSFGLYAVSLPLQFGLLGLPWLPRGTAWSYSLRCLLLIGLSFGIAWLLERRLQPELRRRALQPGASQAQA